MFSHKGEKDCILLVHEVRRAVAVSFPMAAAAFETGLHKAEPALKAKSSMAAATSSRHHLDGTLQTVTFTPSEVVPPVSPSTWIF